MMRRAPVPVGEHFCACGEWEMPRLVAMRFEDPQNVPASFSGYAIGIECPRCGVFLEERFSSASVPVYTPTGVYLAEPTEPTASLNSESGNVSE